MEHVCNFKEISCRRCICFLEVFPVFLPENKVYNYVTYNPTIYTYRGDNGELRVGVRRIARQQSSIPPSVISSQSMHLGVLATASHAVNTHTLFVVYYKPRYSEYCLHFPSHA